MTNTKGKKGWQAGQSGNPKGRPAGVATVAKLRAKIEPDIPALLNVLMKKAMAGDVAAAKILLDRILPPLKATERTQVLQIPAEGLMNQGQAILQAIASGVLSVTEGSSLIGAVGGLARVVDASKIDERINSIEETK